MKKNLIMLLCAALFLSINTFAQSFKPFALTQKSDITGTFPSGSAYTYLFTSQKKNADGSITYRCQLTNAVMRAKDYSTGKVIEKLNTAKLANVNFGSSDVAGKLAMLNKPFTIKVSAIGQVMAVEGLEDIYDAAGKKWQLQANIVDQFKGGIPFVKDDLQRLFLILPADGKVSFGKEWKYKGGNYVVKTITGSRLEIDVKLDSAANSLNGHYTYNDVLHLIESANLKFVINGNTGTQPFTLNETDDIKVAYNARPSKIDTNWLNMAIKASYWSDALKKNGKTDSTRVFNYIAEYDKRYANDPYYMVAKLDLVQRLEYKNSHLTYDSILVLTPNRVLKGHNSHLFNKMRGSLAASVDSTMDLIGYFYDTDSFNSWIHDSFAQQFLNENRNLRNDDGWKDNLRKEKFTEKQIYKLIADYEKSKVNGNQLLIRMANSKIPELKQTAKALDLWVKAKNHSFNKDYLLKLADTLNRLDDNYMKRGNGGRYSLLVYKLLLEQQHPKEANALLERIVAKLEKYTADTLNTERYAHQNMLAYAYYLKYTAAETTDTVKATGYLAKAAQYSPLNNRQKAYSSFYDRVFLNSQESYRDEFLKKLFALGRRDDAMAIFAQHINAQPEVVDEMQMVYNEHIKDVPFKNFLSNQVLSTWTVAPDFKLTGVDGKEHSLADYKGQWLVLDFWGTWCGPCRAELPNVNQFNNDVLAGQFAGVNFMSISCYDTPEKVKTFLAENKYSIPVLMSDNKVQKDYNITGYPSKILISPEGKMLNINFGSDWVSIVKKFTTYLAAN